MDTDDTYRNALLQKNLLLPNDFVPSREPLDLSLGFLQLPLQTLALLAQPRILLCQPILPLPHLIQLLQSPLMCGVRLLVLDTFRLAVLLFPVILLSCNGNAGDASKAVLELCP